MKITSTKTNIQEAAMVTEKIAGRNPLLPILNTVLIYTKDKDLRFLSTNLEMAVEVSISAKIEKEGRVAVPAKLFSSFISSLNKDAVNLESVNGNLIISAKNSTTTIKGYPSEDFPVLPKIAKKNHFTIETSDFVSGLKSVYYAASLSEIKPELNSVFVYSGKNNTLSFAATDTFRLAEKNLSYKSTENISMLIPYKSVVEIIRIFDEQEDSLKITTDENNIVLENKNLKFTSRLIEGNFPDYKKIIPNTFINNITLEKKIYTETLRTSGMFCGKLNEIKIRIYKEEKFIELQTNNPDLGEHTVTIPSETDGGDLLSAYNYRYLMDPVSFINSDKILLRFSGENRPLLITGLNDPSFTYLIMPMKDL